MMNGDLSHQLESFINETTKLDKIRNQSILNIVPEYKELFDGK
jgi:hypothetical protein